MYAKYNLWESHNTLGGKTTAGSFDNCRHAREKAVQSMTALVFFTSTFRSGVAGFALDSSIRAVLQNTVKFMAAFRVDRPAEQGEEESAKLKYVQLFSERLPLPRAQTCGEMSYFSHGNRHARYLPAPSTPSMGGL